MLLLRTKLYRPPVPGDLILRSNLIDRLNQGLDLPLTLVSGPAGYGKTVLLSSWLDTCLLPAIWVSLDENDNDLRVFLAYLVAGIQSVFPGLLSRTQLLTVSPSLPVLAVIAESLINELDEIERRFILVLDDFQAIHDQNIFELLTALLRYPPKSLHLVLNPRQDPPLPQSSLLARHRMTEIRLPELRFSANEVAAFMARATDVPLQDNALTVLAERTEGWAAGLRLAALTLRSSRDADRVVAEMHAENRYVMEYLVSEVLSSVPPGIEEFLIKTSILDELCGSLCDAVLGSEGLATRSQDFLEWLEKANLFTMSLDENRLWYRYHQLFRKLLDNRLQQRFSSGEIDALHFSASSWYADRGRIEDALRHALAGHDTLRAVALVAQNRHHLLNTEQRPRLERWLRLFPGTTQAQHPDLLLAKAWTLETGRTDSQTILGTIGQAQALVDRMTAQPERARQLQGEIDALCSLEKGLAAANAHSTIELATRALETMPREWYLARAEAWLYLALSLQTVGQLDRAYTVLATGQKEEMAESGSPRARIAGSSAFLHWIAADLSSLLQSAHYLVNVSQTENLHDSLGWGHYLLATAEYQRNDLEAAERHANAVQDQRYVSHPISVVQSALVLASIHLARGRPAEARAALDRVTEYLVEIRSEGLLPICQAFGVELAARQGDLDAAGRWASTIVPSVPFGIMGFFYAPQLAYPKVLLAMNTPASRQRTTEALNTLYAFVTSTHNTRFTIEVLALQALLEDAEGDEPAALQALEQALNLAQPGDFIRVFADLGPRMATLLELLAKRGIRPGYIERIMPAFPSFPSHPRPLPQPSQADLIQPLFSREIEILAFLAQRLSAKEIAQRLIISDRTVKRHTANIYQKLGVNSRRDAVAIALALGILPPHP